MSTPDDRRGTDDPPFLEQLRADYAPPPVGPGFEARLRARLEAEQSPRHTMVALLGPALGAAAAVAMAVTLWVHPEPRDDGSPPTATEVDWVATVLADPAADTFEAFAGWPTDEVAAAGLVDADADADADVAAGDIWGDDPLPDSYAGLAMLLEPADTTPDFEGDTQ
jgi:hypothetical protein